ncbi:MAG TPA: hydroxymethylbilane synthase [Rubricoccaceae bacterium]|nr:hydroxymethylbilane synthase [Rubricoccaceae bacterium]
MEPTRERIEVRIGTRKSRLARWQAEHVARRIEAACPGVACRLILFETTGDRQLGRPLPAIGGKGVFTAELEAALRDGAIDLAVHSLKDLPVEEPEGLTLGAILARADVRDALVTRDAASLAELPAGAVVGTSSLRRSAQLLAARPDLRVEDLRGNVETRIRKVREGPYDAALLAVAGLERLGLLDAVAERLPLDVMLPAPGQAALAVQVRAGDGEIAACVGLLDDLEARAATTAERLFLGALGGGCAAPVAAHATVGGGMIHLRGRVAAVDGGHLIEVAAKGARPAEVAAAAAAEAHAKGAEPLLAR